MIKVSDFIAKYLNEIVGVEHVFMVSGGGAMHLNDSFGKYMKHISNHNEQASSICGEGYARFSEKLSVVNVTTGPGGLNALNGVFGSWTDSVPVLFISGQVKHETTINSCRDIPLRQLGDQEVDIISVVKNLTKYSVMVKKANEIKYHLKKAIWEATNNRFGPVWLDIPMNIQGSLIDENELKDFTTPKENKPNLHIKEVINKIKNSKHPLIVLGHGIRLSNTQNLISDLLKKINVPIVSTLNGFDLITNENPNYIGRIGTIGQRAANFTLQNSDCVLFLGTRNNIRQVSYNWENFAKNAFKIVVDIDKAELKKPLVKPDLSINANLKDFLPALINESQIIKRDKWLTWCIKCKNQYNFNNTIEYQQKSDIINPYYFVHRLTKYMEENNVCIMGNASATVCTFQTAIVKKNQRFITNSGDASMGYDLPAAIGACIANNNNNNNTICLTGDGSIMMNIQELETIKHYNLPIKIFIINNKGYVSIKQTQDNFFKRRCGSCPNSGVTMPNFVEVGESFGINSIKLKNPKDIDKTIKKVLNSKKPILCVVDVEPEYIFTPKLSSRKLNDGTMVSPSLEDMFPFLDRKELKENMIIDLVKED
jgi:acetolactate synthase-1/2/3 large subunit